jgi:hypothetical protein
MYVARFKKESIKHKVYIIEKTWSEEIMSNNVQIIDSKTFFFKFRAKRWSEKRIVKMMMDLGKLEILNG